MKRGIEYRLLRRRVVTSEGCWLWTGCKNNQNYGTIRHEGKLWLVHRLSLLIYKPIEYDEKLQVNHKRDCKSRACFNPDHVYSGNQIENMADAAAIGIKVGVNFDNANTAKTHCPQGHEYTLDNTYYQSKGGYKSRKCKQCRIIHNKNRFRVY